jgi:hypothetical protein
MSDTDDTRVTLTHLHRSMIEELTADSRLPRPHKILCYDRSHLTVLSGYTFIAPNVHTCEDPDCGLAMAVWHDDTATRPACLEAMLAAVKDVPKVAAALAIHGHDLTHSKLQRRIAGEFLQHLLQTVHAHALFQVAIGMVAMGLVHGPDEERAILDTVRQGKIWAGRQPLREALMTTMTEPNATESVLWAAFERLEGDRVKFGPIMTLGDAMELAASGVN